MKQEIVTQCYLKSLSGLTYREIAEELNLSASTVSRAIDKITKSHDYQIGISTISTFLEEYQRAADFFKMQIGQLEKRKDTDPDNFYKIMDMQMERMALVVQLVGQGKVAMALKELRDNNNIQLQPDRELTQITN